MQKGERRLRTMIAERDILLRERAGEIDVLRRALGELASISRICDRCVHRMCSECGASIAGRYASALTCSVACRVARKRRLDGLGVGDITDAMGQGRPRQGAV